MDIHYNEGQATAIDKSYEWYVSTDPNKNPTFEISGPAGSGKTTIIYGLVERLKLDVHKDVTFMALIGQAALVMRTKNLDANTIHGSIYQMYDDIVTDTDGKPVLDANNKLMTKMGWYLRDSLENPNCKLIVVDEGSMVDKKIKNDILSFGIPVIVLGDLDQLQPIYGEPAFLQEPDIILTKIERHAEGHPIIELSARARKNLPIEVGSYGENCEVQVITQDQLTDEMLVSTDIVICGKNKTRNILNARIRKILGFEGSIPNVGERLVFRKNDWSTKVDDIIAITNGLQGYVVNPIDTSELATTGNIIADIRPVICDSSYFASLPLDYEYFMQGCKSGKYVNPYNEGEKCEFGYTITCHMSQGSQYDSVLVYEEVLNRETHKKWLYTAITRAVNKLIIVKPLAKKKYSSGRNTYSKRRW